VDEGQDFKEEWFKSLYNFLADDGSLYVFYDELQMLYEKFGQTDISFLYIGAKYNLKRNMRNTDEICLSSLKVIDVDEKSILLNGVNGLRPEILFGESQTDVMEKLKNTLKDLKNQDIQDEKITVLVTNAKKKLIYLKAIKDYSNVMVESVRKYKGLENDIIIIPDLKEEFLGNEETKKLLYVAMSRARVHVIMIVGTESLNRKQRAAFKKDIEFRLI
jgi:DNA helicase IV